MLLYSLYINIAFKAMKDLDPSLKDNWISHHQRPDKSPANRIKGSILPINVMDIYCSPGLPQWVKLQVLDNRTCKNAQTLCELINVRFFRWGLLL